MLYMYLNMVFYQQLPTTVTNSLYTESSQERTPLRCIHLRKSGIELRSNSSRLGSI